MTYRDSSPTPTRPEPGEWNYLHHTQTPILKAATDRARRWYQPGDRVVVDNPRVAYLRGAVGTVVGLQTSAVVVALDDPAPSATSRYVDLDGMVRCDSTAIAQVAR